jgi:hypothetical protein
MLPMVILDVLTHDKFMRATAGIIHDSEAALCNPYEDCYDDGYHKGHPTRGASVWS